VEPSQIQLDSSPKSCLRQLPSYLRTLKNWIPKMTHLLTIKANHLVSIPSFSNRGPYFTGEICLSSPRVREFKSTPEKGLRRLGFPGRNFKPKRKVWQDLYKCCHKLRLPASLITFHLSHSAVQYCISSAAASCPLLEKDRPHHYSNSYIVTPYNTIL